jgi:hypothetical protein
VVRTPEGCHGFSDTRSGCGIVRLLSGGLRNAPTTGYYLPALQAETTARWYGPHRHSVIRQQRAFLAQQYGNAALLKFGLTCPVTALALEFLNPWESRKESLAKWNVHPATATA